MKTKIKNYIEYEKGQIPLILTAPHGGNIKPSNMDMRESGVFDRDDYTAELTIDIIKEFEKQINKTPYYLIADISRKIVDLNRQEEEAYELNEAKAIYDTFHNTIKEYEKEIEEKFGKGIYIDIHGQSHPKAYLEFGYLLDNEILRQHDHEINLHKNRSSIRTLSNFSKESFIDQLKGPHSLGSLMCNEGYDSIPSIKLPYASDGNYFEGAYDTITYGSLNGRNISGIQIEFPYKNVRDSKENRKKCAQSFVVSVLKFMEIHLGVKL